MEDEATATGIVAQVGWDKIRLIQPTTFHNSPSIRVIRLHTTTVVVPARRIRLFIRTGAIHRIGTEETEITVTPGILTPLRRMQVEGLQRALELTEVILRILLPHHHPHRTMAMTITVDLESLQLSFLRTAPFLLSAHLSL
jgi:hypothetical protein